MCIAALALTACGGKSGSSSSSGESEGSSEGGLAAGKWPASIYDKYGIPEPETKGKSIPSLRIRKAPISTRCHTTV